MLIFRVWFFFKFNVFGARETRVLSFERSVCAVALDCADVENNSTCANKNVVNVENENHLLKRGLFPSLIGGRFRNPKYGTKKYTTDGQIFLAVAPQIF